MTFLTQIIANGFNDKFIHLENKHKEVADNYANIGKKIYVYHSNESKIRAIVIQYFIN
jgi:hypothetical protein